MATVDRHRLAVGNASLLEQQGVARDGLATRSDELADQGRTSVQVAIDGEAAAVIAVADAPRETSAQAIRALREQGVRAVMLSGDSQATAERIAGELGIDEVIAEVLPADKAARSESSNQIPNAVALKRLRLRDQPAASRHRLRPAHRASRPRRCRRRRPPVWAGEVTPPFEPDAA